MFYVAHPLNLCCFLCAAVKQIYRGGAEQSVSNVTAEGKKSAQTDRETPFWRIKSVKWLWESRERRWASEPA